MDMKEYFLYQKQLQNLMFGHNLPNDSVEDFKYSVLGLVGELGEVLEADKRWKTVRNFKYDREQKLDELVDCMAFMINMILFSGINEEEFAEAFKEKFTRNVARFREEELKNAKAEKESYCDI